MANLITIQGEVVNALDDSPLADIKVIARQEGIEIQQETDNQGKFTLHLLPGLWRISAWGKGFTEPEAYLYNFSADTDAIDFRLQEGYSISGWVIKQENGQPASGVIVEAKMMNDSLTLPKRELTDENGRFRFSGLLAGRWQVRGAQAESQTNQEVRTVGPDVRNVHLTLARRMTQTDWNWGLGLFASLCLLLGILASIYIETHRRFTSGPEPEMRALTGQIEQAEKIVAEINDAEEPSETALQALRSSVTGLKKNWDSVSNTLISLTEGQNSQATLLVNQAEAAAMANNASETAFALANLMSVFDERRSVYFWSEPPMNYLEVLFWSLAGILVSLLVTNGYYLRQKRFYPEGIWMHASHLLSVPLLALVFVFLISQVHLSVQIDDSMVALNINDPRMLAAISFIIAVRPWGMIDFVREAARRFFGQIQSRIAGSSETQVQPENA